MAGPIVDTRSKFCWSGHDEQVQGWILLREKASDGEVLLVERAALLKLGSSIDEHDLSSSGRSIITSCPSPDRRYG
jgi:hypothetical protein